MANLLLPRAVAYSAGLINFFFRGKIDISLPDEGVFAVSDHGIGAGFKKLRVKIKNSTEIFQDAQGNPQLQGMIGGTFFAVIRYHKDRQYVGTLDTVVGVDPCDGESTVINLAKADATTQCRDGIEQIVVSEPLTGEALSYTEEKTVTFKFAGTPIPYAMTDVVLQIVYRGPLGSEADAVAVGTLDISEPTYFSYQNASDYVHIGEHVHTRSEINSSPELLSLVRPQYCVDYRQSPPRLFDACFRQFDLDLVVGFGDISTPLAEARGIPPRHLMRIVYLTTADEAAGAAAKRAERRKLQATALRHTEGKALLNQQGSCLPFDPFDIPPRHSQLTMLSTTEPSYRLGLFSSLRGVNGWFSTSCVVNGDQSEPGEWDDRNTTMTELDKDTDEVQPVSVTIMQQYQ
jgi:hypothetical protein